MAIEVEAGLDGGHFAGASNSLPQPATSAYNDANETPKSANAGTFRAEELLRMSGLEALPSPAGQVQWPELPLLSSPGSAKSYTLTQALVTSGAPVKTVLDRIEPPVVRPTPKRREHVVLQQQWEGYVERLTPKGFEALLVDITGGAGEEERTEIDLDEVSGFDRPLIAPGAVFYWSMGYRVRTSGQREGMSIIRFRRLPAWTPEELAEADRAAEATRAALGWDREPNVTLADETRTG